MPQVHEFLLPRRLLGRVHPRSVGSDHLRGIRHEHRDGYTDQRKDEETDVGAILDRAGLVLDVLPEGHRCSNDSTEVENGPKDGDEATLLAFGRVCEH